MDHIMRALRQHFDGSTTLLASATLKSQASSLIIADTDSQRLEFCSSSYSR